MMLGHPVAGVAKLLRLAREFGRIAQRLAGVRPLDDGREIENRKWDHRLEMAGRAAISMRTAFACRLPSRRLWPNRAEMHCLDQAKIFIRSGAGGPGAVSFRREKFVEFGGPDGGNGGKGGDIVFEAVAGLNTLIDFRYTQHFRAPRGKGGSGSNRTGAGGDDLIVKVPVGTQILADDEDRTLLADLTKEGERVTLLQGGIGGRGNASYKTSTNRAPRQHQTGTPGEEMWVWLRLKLLADVGLVGLPNAGKSTFLNSVTNA